MKKGSENKDLPSTGKPVTQPENRVYGLTVAESRFVVAIVDNELAGGKLTDAEVAIQAGYSKKPGVAAERASMLRSSPKIAAAIAARKTELAAQFQPGSPSYDSIRILREWAEIAAADPTDVITVRRLNCRHCWGRDFHYRYTDAEYAKESAEEMQAAARLGVEPDLQRFWGGGGFRYTDDPNPACPECCGEGVEDVTVKDFRKLRGPARRLIAGVKQGKHGIEVQFRDQGEALKLLAQNLGMLVNKQEHSGPNGGPIPVAAATYALPSDPVEAARAYQAIMEGKPVK